MEKVLKKREKNISKVKLRGVLCNDIRYSLVAKVLPPRILGEIIKKGFVEISERSAKKYLKALQEKAKERDYFKIDVNQNAYGMSVTVTDHDIMNGYLCFLEELSILR